MAMKNQSWVISHSGRTFGKKPVLTACIQLTPKDEVELANRAYEQGFLDALNVEPPAVDDPTDETKPNAPKPKKD